MLDKLISTNNRLIELEFQKYEIEASREKLIIEMLNDLREKKIWNKFPTEEDDCYRLTFSDEDNKFYYEISKSRNRNDIFITKNIYDVHAYNNLITHEIVDFSNSYLISIDMDLFIECMELLNGNKCIKFTLND